MTRQATATEPGPVPARISVAVITYNWPEALELVLRSLAAQTELPHEVIVTDDGSQPATRDLLERMAVDYPVRLVHLWQADDGARMSRARNRAIAAAQGDYVILLDGDMLAERNFIADHRAFARRGCFVQGSRVLTDAALSQRLLRHALVMPGFFSRGVGRRRHTLHLPTLAAWYARPGRKRRGIKSCNMAFWRDDLLAINGFNEAMTGWGREDTELAARAFHLGLLRRDLRFSALATHLYHQTRKQLVDNPNDRILDATRAGQLVRCELGLDQHLAEFTRAPPDIRAPRGQPRAAIRTAASAPRLPVAAGRPTPG
ncbi:MAG: glycosyltransferase family 2 protein [Xanthomonadaceae bacterium]|nr:glycosyltransferase family 2 protein [Xanthomonadaceae bacterium]